MSDLEQIFADMPIARLAQLGGMSVTEIAVYALGGAAGASRAATGVTSGRGGGRGRKAAATSNGAKATSGRKAAAAVRTASGRGDFDARVLEAISAAGEPVRSVDIEAKVGGTPEQRRAALHRLVAAKKLKRAGKARATTYEAR
jgi:hypothetical protein